MAAYAGGLAARKHRPRASPERDGHAALFGRLGGGEHLTREEHAADAPRWAHFLRPPPPRFAALDDDGAEPFLLLDASFRQSYTNWIVMHSSNQCDISFAVDLCAQIDESD